MRSEGRDVVFVQLGLSDAERLGARSMTTSSRREGRDVAGHEEKVDIRVVMVER